MPHDHRAVEPEGVDELEHERGPTFGGRIRCRAHARSSKAREIDGEPPRARGCECGQEGCEVAYNTRRPHQALGWKTPAEYRAERLAAMVPIAA